MSDRLTSDAIKNLAVHSRPNQAKSLGLHFMIKRSVPTGPNQQHSPDPPPMAHSYDLNHEIKKKVPSGPNPLHHKHSPHASASKNYQEISLDPVPTVAHSSMSKKYGFRFGIKRLVPTGPNQAQSPDPGHNSFVHS
ncbi:hypothetical protein SESBI_44803 [Sesbania bispinosa]|nr:hypothetical protein SESBI_44803 [Sesbania bispinosa]